MRYPSVKTLSQIFENPKEVKRILHMDRSQLLEIPVCYKLQRESYGKQPDYILKLTAINHLAGLHGVEGIETSESYADYLNTGETYTPTLIRYGDSYRVQSVGDFVETLERNGVKVK